MSSTADRPSQADVRIGAVTASTADGVEAGRQILRAGGNAVDAAVATALASCVADPCNTGLGGLGGHMVMARLGEAPVCVDFNVWAPAGVQDCYRNIHEPGPGASAVPNVVAGLSAALSSFGSMNWAEVSEPALALATEGVIANVTTTLAFKEVEGAEFLAECFAFEMLSEREGGAFRFRQPKLARTLEKMAKYGPDWFYTGPIGALGSKILRDNGLAITAARWAEALDAVNVACAPSLRLQDARLFSAPLETSGSVCMFATATAGEELALGQGMETPAAVCDWARRIASVWSYRFGTVGGNHIDANDLEGWVGRAMACRRQAILPTGLGHTCHLNVADANGTLVAATLTHGPLWFGARWALPGTGVIMNIGGPLMCADDLGIVGSRVHGISNMCPTIALTDGGAAVAVGCPGARRIPTIVGTVLARHLFARAGLQEAISHGRFHAESRDLVTLETGRWSGAVEDALRSEFDVVEEEGPQSYYGPLTAIHRKLNGAVELGLDDRWRGYGAIVP